MSVVVGPEAGGGAQSGIHYLPNVYNYDRKFVNRFRTAFDNYAYFGGKCRIGWGGDSAAMSYGAHPTFNKMALYATDAQLARRINTFNQRTDCTYQSTFGVRGLDNIGDFDLRLTTTGFTKSDFFSFGGPLMNGVTAGNKLSFTPKNEQGTQVAVSRFVVYYVQNVGFASFTVDIDGANSQSVPAAGATQIQKAVIDTTLGNHTINITVGSGQVFICGIEAYNNTTTARCDILNLGWSGSWLGSWIDTTNDWQPFKNWGVLDLDLVFWTCGFNDYVGGATLQQIYDASIAYINTIKASGADVIIVGYPPVNPVATGLDYNTQASLNQNAVQIAFDSDCPFIDMFERLNRDYANSYLMGQMFDDYHLSGAGCSNRADVEYSVMTF